MAWNELTSHSTPFIHESLGAINNCIWFSTSYQYGEKGIVQYDCESDANETTKYPYNAVIRNHCCCADQNNIYIVDGLKRRIIMFNPSNKKFTKIVDIPYLGKSPCAIIIDDYLHIFNGEQNTQHIIYSMKHYTVQTINDPTSQNKANGVCILNYKNRIIKFGGKDREASQLLDSFYMSSVIEPDAIDDITWDKKKQYQLKCPLNQCGYILFKNYIITFGGATATDKYTDAIYILNLNKDHGWIEVKHTKCPIASQYRAVLVDEHYVHLYTRFNKWPNWQESAIKHYSICIKEIVKDVRLLVMGYMKMYVFGKKVIDPQQYDVSLNSIIMDFLSAAV